jgi:hypothetical protein
MDRRSGSQSVKAVLTDVQFWVPAGVLLVGILLLVFLH